MLGKKRNRHECMYGCCRTLIFGQKLFTKARERRIFRSREKRAWKKEEGI